MCTEGRGVNPSVKTVACEAIDELEDSDDVCLCTGELSEEIDAPPYRVQRSMGRAEERFDEVVGREFQNVTAWTVD